MRRVGNGRVIVHSVEGHKESGCYGGKWKYHVHTVERGEKR